MTLDMTASVEQHSPKSSSMESSLTSQASVGIMCGSSEKEDFEKSMLLIEDEEPEENPEDPCTSGNSVAFAPTRSVSTPVVASPPMGQVIPSSVSSPAVIKDSESSSSTEGSYQRHQAKRNSWLNGLLVCLRPVWGMLGKSGTHFQTGQDDWEIPFENIQDLQWLGSGAQGAVFLGELEGELVAVKKVREKNETDIRHLRHLRHPNIVTFKGVCTQAPCYCIIMEFCPYGQLYEMLRSDHAIPPNKLVDWCQQIVAGMDYLHQNRIIHRDLKSPNVLISLNEVLKISDFGTCRQLNDISTKMSFAGTVAWMAPEIIRHEPCSEKVDIWSFGVVLWELLTREVPYKDVDSSAIIWGVGSNSLHLPVPVGCPEAFRILLKQCWSPKPRNRPSFHHIQLYLETAAKEILEMPEEEFVQSQGNWRREIEEYMQNFQDEDNRIPLVEEDLVKQRREELRHAQDIREHYERKLERANSLYMELATCLLQLEQRERDLLQREENLQVHANRAGDKMYKKHIVRPLLRAHERLTKKRSLKSQSQQGKTTEEASECQDQPNAKKTPHLYLTNPGVGRSTGQAAVYVAEVPHKREIEVVCSEHSPHSSFHQNLDLSGSDDICHGRRAVIYNLKDHGHHHQFPCEGHNSQSKNVAVSESYSNSNVANNAAVSSDFFVHRNHPVHHEQKSKNDSSYSGVPIVHSSPAKNFRKQQRYAEQARLYGVLKEDNSNETKTDIFMESNHQYYPDPSNGNRTIFYGKMYPPEAGGGRFPVNAFRTGSVENLDHANRRHSLILPVPGGAMRDLGGSYNNIYCSQDRKPCGNMETETVMQDRDGNILKKRWYHSQVLNPDNSAIHVAEDQQDYSPPGEMLSEISNLRLAGGHQDITPFVHRHLRRHTMTDAGSMIPHQDPAEMNRLNRNSLPPMYDTYGAADRGSPSRNPAAVAQALW